MHKSSLAVLLSSIAAFSAIRSDAATISYNLDFGNNPDVPTDVLGNAFQALLPFGFNTLHSESWSIGDGITLAFASVNNYAFGDTTNPLITDGLFTTTSTTFTLSGLPQGASVKLYASAAWDGVGRAAFISLEGSGLIDTATAPNDGFTGSTPGRQILTSEMALIASGVTVSNTGILSGVMSSGGRQEGQLGGFIVEVTTVPEPTSAALLAGSALALGGVRRRRQGA